MLIRTTEGDEARNDALKHCVGIAVEVDRGLFNWTQKGPSKGKLFFSFSNEDTGFTDSLYSSDNAGRLFCTGLDIPMGETPDKPSDKRLLLDHLSESIDLDTDLKEKVMYMSDRGIRECALTRKHWKKI